MVSPRLVPCLVSYVVNFTLVARRGHFFLTDLRNYYMTGVTDGISLYTIGFCGPRHGGLMVVLLPQLGHLRLSF
jgi:hypothetical protein